MVDKPKLLVLSSLIFITNALVAFFKKYYLYAVFFLILTITSVIVHNNNNMYTNLIDKLAILLVVIYGGYLLFQKMCMKHATTCFLIILSFLLVIYLYAYGYMHRVYCFSEDKSVGDAYHYILHLISSFGHHLIIIL